MKGTARRFTLSALPLLGLAAIGCATARPVAGPAPERPPIPIVATSFESSRGIVARIEGTAAVRDDWLYLVLPTGAVRTQQRSGQEYWDLTVRAGLLTCGAAHQWQLVSESRAVRLAPVLGLTRDNALLDSTTRAFKDTLRMDLGIPRSTALEHAWLMFTLEWPISSVVATYTIPTSGGLTPGTSVSAAGASRSVSAGPSRSSVGPDVGGRCE